MEFEYRFISEKRCNEIDSWQIKDPYGYGKAFIAKGKKFVTNEDESILFSSGFMPRHDDFAGNYETYLFISNKEWHYVRYRVFNTVYKQEDNIKYYFGLIKIVEENFIEENYNKENLLQILKYAIDTYEHKRHITLSENLTIYSFKFYYKEKEI